MQIKGIPRIFPGDLTRDSPVVSLIAVNVVTIGLAILGNWDPATVMFIYWTQSIIIGFFTVIALLSANTGALAADLSRPIVERGGSGVSTVFAGGYQVILALFFCIHYGLFHWVYYSFIVESGIFGSVNFSDPGIWLSCGLFFVNHLYSFIVYRRQEPQGASHINELFFSPYRRIVPMHLTIIFGGIAVVALGFLGITTHIPVLLLFLVLKTWTDITGHISKHAGREGSDTPDRYL